MRLSLDECSTSNQPVSVLLLLYHFNYIDMPPGFSFTQSPTHLSLPEKFPGMSYVKYLLLIQYLFIYRCICAKYEPISSLYNEHFTLWYII